MRSVTTIIVGAGQSGLAMSHCLSAFSIEHVLLERGQTANSWRTDRWDSLRLLTPNWQSRLPGFTYSGADPDGYRTLSETIEFLDSYARAIEAPVETDTTVMSVCAHDAGYRIKTDQGEWSCRCVVLANGAMTRAAIPSVASDLPGGIRSLSVKDYKRPDDVEDGGVLIVGASASGVQLAQELQRAGREVLLSVGEHVRVPRTYRGRDILWLMDAAGMFDDTIDNVDDVNRVRGLPSMQLSGTTTHKSLDLNRLQSEGVSIAGRFVGFRDGVAQFSGALANVCRLADLKMNRLLRSIDDWIRSSGLYDGFSPAEKFESTHLPATPPLQVDLRDRGVKTIIWATGLQPDYSWLDLPVFDRHGRLRHKGGIVDAPGVYAMGLPFMRKRKSSFIDGAADDARDLSKHLAAYLDVQGRFIDQSPSQGTHNARHPDCKVSA